MTIELSIRSEEQIHPSQPCDLSQTKPQNGFPSRAVLPLVSACLLITFSCGIGQSSYARDFVVACTETASDENEGTVESPLRTIGAAIRAAEPGDVVSVLAGDYRSEENGFGVGVIPVTNSGAFKNPIRIKAAANNDVIVGKFLLSNCHDIVIEGFQVRGLDFSTIDGWQPMPNIVRNPNANLPRPDFTQPFETRETQIREEFATYFSLVEQLDFTTGIDLENCQRVNVFGNDIRGYFGGVQCRGCSQIKIHFNVIRDCTNGIFTFYASDGTTPGVIGASIRYNDIQQSLDNGIDIRAGSEAVQIDDNYVAFSGRSHISLQGAATRCKVQYNAALRGGFYSETMEFPGSSGISLNDAGPSNTVLRNYVALQQDLTGIDGNGIIIDFLREDAQAVVDDNISFCNAGAGLNLTASPGNLIRGNIFAFNGHRSTEFRRGAGIKISRDQDIDNTIVNNLLILNRAAGILSSGTISAQENVDRNLYLTTGEPLIWDGFDIGDREYRTLMEVQAVTGWERRGAALVW